MLTKIEKPNVITLEVARCLAILQAADRPIVAADLAGRLYLPGCRESQRRHVRAIVKYLRDGGSQIVATLQGGYWLTDDMQLWRDYIEGRTIDAKRCIGQMSAKKKMLTDLTGQGILFGPVKRTGIG